MTENDRAALRFSDAVFRVWRTRNDFVAIVMAAHRELAAKIPRTDPFVSAGNLQFVLDGAEFDLNKSERIDARLEMVRALLHVWYKVPADLKCAVMDAVQNRYGQDVLGR